MAKFKTMDDFEFKGRTVLVRVDFNSPLEKQTKQILDDTRIREHAATLKELSDKGGKVVVLAHQGRPGDEDFSSLQLHAERLGKILGKPVKYTDDIFGEKAKSAIKALKAGEILVLNNVRIWPDEQAKKKPEEFADTDFIRGLAPLADLFVNDAFGAAHRGHASMVGFTVLLPSAVGKLMERELNALSKVRDSKERPCVYVLGGAKAEDTASIIEYVLGNDKADSVLTGGIVANLCMASKGIDIGRPNTELLEKQKSTELMPKVRELLDKYKGKILIPTDVALSVDGKRSEIGVSRLPTNCPIYDIGKATAKQYAEVVDKAKIVFLNGPMGVFEKDDFMNGTKTVFEAIAESKAYKVAGGGHTISAIDKLNLNSKFSYISTGGGVLMEFLMGKNLPAVAALEKAAVRS